jgi:hypothetical protein
MKCAHEVIYISKPQPFIWSTHHNDVSGVTPNLDHALFKRRSGFSEM